MFIFKKKKLSATKSETKDWLEKEQEGELSIDAYETKSEIVIQSTIAGVSAKDLDISVEDDMLIIKGQREKLRDEDAEKNYFQQECFWGPFAKKIILPEKVKITQARAVVKNGILTLKIPKTNSAAKEKITIKDKK